MFGQRSNVKNGFLGSRTTPSLPVTGDQTYRNHNTSKRGLLSVITRLFKRRNTNDGSASSIHIAPSLAQVWERTSVATKASWITLLTTLLMIYIGYRYIRYYNTGVNLDCQNANICSLKLIHLGYKRPTSVKIGRHQILRSEPVKITKDGTFVSGNASIKVEYYNPNTKKNKKNKYQNVNSLNYKGPDEDGNYLSYAIYFRDKSDNPIVHSEVEEIIDMEFDISDIHTYTTETDTGEYRLIITQQVPDNHLSKRRIRTMTQKLDSYIHKRRPKISIREVSGPAWQGVLLIVIGTIGFILCTLLGQFHDEVIATGPGMRRNMNNTNNNNQHQQHRSNVNQVVSQRQTPLEYEVSMNGSSSSSNNKNGRIKNNNSSTVNRKRSY